MKTKFRLNRIGLKSLDRSGSNLILALFHYHSEFFSLTEKFQHDTRDYNLWEPTKDRAWYTEQGLSTNKTQPAAAGTGSKLNSLLQVMTELNIDYEDLGPNGLTLREEIGSNINSIRQYIDSIKPPTYFVENPKTEFELINWLQSECFSMFNGTDNSTKKIDEVRNLIIKIPKEYIWQDEEHRNNYKNSKGSYCKLKYAKHKYDKKLYLIRNPFRVAMSLRPPELANGLGNPKIAKDMLLLREIADYTIDIISEYKADIENGVDSKIIFLEYFLKNFEKELPKLINWVDQDAKPNSSLDIGKDFMNSTPNFHGTNYNIKGIQNFDPNTDIDYKRTMNRKLLRTFTTSPLRNHELLSYVENKLGPLAFDYWIHDIRYDYDHNLYLEDINLA